jgi:hypothetical protein
VDPVIHSLDETSLLDAARDSIELAKIKTSILGLPIMSDKEAVLELVQRLPAEASLQQILQEIQFIAAVKEGLDQIDQGKGVSIEAVEQMLDTWITQ